jgi:solute carrier family 50 protein (sugar transporter)
MTASWIINLFVPTLSVIINNIMFLTPMLAVLDARKAGALGPLNPLPFAMIVLTTIGWVYYSIMLQNYFLFFANCPGMIMGFFFSLSSVKLLARAPITEANERFLLIFETILVCSVIMWAIVILFTALVYKDTATGTNLVGGLAAATAIMYFAIPLSSLYQIFQTKDASSLYIPTISANFTNCVLFFFYGVIALNDPNVYVPNALGATLACTQIGIAYYFRNTTAAIKKKRLEDAAAAVGNGDASGTITHTNSYKANDDNFTVMNVMMTNTAKKDSDKSEETKNGDSNA